MRISPSVVRAWLPSYGPGSAVRTGLPVRTWLRRTDRAARADLAAVLRA
ncbi:hypothetical protein [Streptomyces shaanxiensis]